MTEFISEDQSNGKGRFEWIERMGRHEAYHQSFINRLFHWICIPIELFGVLKMTSLLTLFGTISFAHILILVSGLVFMSAEWIIGAAMTVLLIALLHIAQTFTLGISFDAIFGLLCFIVPFIAQTQLGHRFFEPDSRDDTAKNLAELKRSKNPIPILLIFFYHMAELFFAASYRPTLYKTVNHWTEKEREKFD